VRTDLIYGIHAIWGLLKAHPEDIQEIFFLEARADKRLQALLKEAREQGIVARAVSKKDFEHWLPSVSHQGIAARLGKEENASSLLGKASLSEEDLLELLQKAKKWPLLLILDCIQDPHNLGACLRTADAVGIDAVILPKDRSATLTPVVRKVASGAAETVPLVQVTNLARTLAQLKELGVWIIGASMAAQHSLYQIDFKCPAAIVLGAEGTGLRRLTEENCDLLMNIPMVGSVESLNVSVAAAVCLYEAFRQRI
jgi:23S rRNA (guanosine2251-2'-O)-methyltransferase